MGSLQAQWIAREFKDHDEQVDWLAKIMADKVGHGMREKCRVYAEIALGLFTDQIDSTAKRCVKIGEELLNTPGDDLAGYLGKIRGEFSLVSYPLELPEDTQESLELLVKTGHILEDGTPTKCHMCGGVDLKECNRDYLGGTLCEYDVECESCGSTIGNWAYGGWGV